MTTSKICNLIAASSALLDAEELFFGLTLPDQAGKARSLADDAMALARSTIRQALIAPEDANQRLKLLELAIDLDGTESSLVACVARALAETAEAQLETEFYF